MNIVRTVISTAWIVLSLAIGLDATPILHCGAGLGTQFNLEPAVNAVPQQLEAVDFIPNGVALNEDLVVGGAFDSRGITFAAANATTPNWDASVGGYYVRRSSAAGCAPQFEGGLPVIEAGGNGFTSNGGVAVAADPVRAAFFVADRLISCFLGDFVEPHSVPERYAHRGAGEVLLDKKPSGRDRSDSFRRRI